MGKCPDCGTWDALEEYRAEASAMRDPHRGLAASWSAFVEGGDNGAGDALGGELPGAGAGGNPGNPGNPGVPGAPVATPIGEIGRGERVSRLSTGISEFDRVLGGGLVPGSAVLIGGDPGIGKSTLMLQAALALGARGVRTLYVSSEESAEQVAMRAERLGGEGIEASRRRGNSRNEKNRDGVETGGTPVPPGGVEKHNDPSPRAPRARRRAALGGVEKHKDPSPCPLPEGEGKRGAGLWALADTNLARIVEQARRVRPRVMVIDSVQMIYKSDLDASPGSVAQLRRCCVELVYLAKVSDIAVVLVGHVTKDGALAGPRLLEHLVDSVLYFEGDHHHAHRVIRAVKNRFGTTLELGLFEMTDAGLRGVEEGGGVAARVGETARPGSVVCPVVSGTRCLLVELQALTATGFLGAAKRKASGVDGNRLAMLIAVLEQHGGLRLADRDVFASAVGGVRVVEPAADLALALAIAGAHHRRALAPECVAIGEVGLGGEVRAVSRVEQRLRDAARLGYTRAIVGPARSGVRVKGIGVDEVKTVGEAVERLG